MLWDGGGGGEIGGDGGLGGDAEGGVVDRVLQRIGLLSKRY